MRQELCNVPSAAVCTSKETRPPSGEKIWRIMQPYLPRTCKGHVKLHKNAFMHATMARVKVRRWLRGGWRMQQKRGPDAQTKDFQTPLRYRSCPFCDFTAEGTRQLQHELNCSLVPGWVSVCPFFPIFPLCYPSRQCRAIMIFHSEGEPIQWPHRYDTLMQMMDRS